MGCCDESYPIDGIYVPLYKRLVEYGEEVYGEGLMKKYKRTSMWLFSFYKDEDLCIECEDKFAEMAQWFNKYGFIDNSVKNVKWIIDDEIDNNMILKDMNIKKAPVHMFCDENGKLIDMVFGFPAAEWLEKYILPLLRD